MTIDSSTAALPLEPVACPLCGAAWPEPEWDYLARLVTVREMA